MRLIWPYKMLKQTKLNNGVKLWSDPGTFEFVIADFEYCYIGHVFVCKQRNTPSVLIFKQICFASPLFLAVCKCVYIFGVNLCCQVAKILKKNHLYVFENVWSNGANIFILLVTFTFIFEVKVLAIFLICEYPVNGER